MTKPNVCMTIPSAEEVEELEERLKGLENQVHALNRKVRHREEEIEALRKENVLLIRNSFRHLGKLYYVYLVTGSAGAVTNRLKMIWKDACGRPEKLSRLVRYLDRHMAHLIRDLRSSVPNLKDEEIVMFCCFAVGFEAPLVAELSGNRVDAVYYKKSRMLGKIKKLGPERARRFLELLE